MKLSATVIDTHSASQYDDKTRRVTLKVDAADCMNTRLTVKSDELQEDEALTVLVLRQDDADTLYHTLHDLQRIGQTNQIMDQTIDQLRPDPPPPFLINDADAYQQRYEKIDAGTQPDTATTQEFQLGGTA